MKSVEVSDMVRDEVKIAAASSERDIVAVSRRYIVRVEYSIQMREAAERFCSCCQLFRM